MKIAIILGTRPEIIKMSPVIRECERRKLDYFILHTGQHYTYNLDQVFFEQLGLPKSNGLVNTFHSWATKDETNQRDLGSIVPTKPARLPKPKIGSHK